MFGNGNLQVPNLSVFGLQVENPFSFLGISFAQDAGLLIFVTILFCVVGMIVILVQRRSFGRRLVALRDSPDAASMLGMSLTLTKLSVFMFSAAIAGLAGGLFAIYYSSVGTTDFQLTVGLPYLLLLVVGGMTTVGGTIIGAIGLVQFAWFNQAFPDNTFLTWFSNLGPGLIGIGVGRNPEGVWEQNVQAGRQAAQADHRRPRRRAADAGHAHAVRGARGDQAALARAARRHRPSRRPSCATSPSASAACSRSTRSASTCRTGRSSASSGRTARARRRCSTSPPACRSPTRAGSSSTAGT